VMGHKPKPSHRPEAISFVSLYSIAFFLSHLRNRAALKAVIVSLFPTDSFFIISQQ
jgi:hypothetical protein